ncbi:MAG: hypothetical protein ACR2O4_14445 [Hyphomicrobiaceae bacterium]
MNETSGEEARQGRVLPEKRGVRMLVRLLVLAIAALALAWWLGYTS